jgi:hypothetical protein
MTAQDLRKLEEQTAAAPLDFVTIFRLTEIRRLVRAAEEKEKTDAEKK